MLDGGGIIELVVSAVHWENSQITMVGPWKRVDSIIHPSGRSLETIPTPPPLRSPGRIEYRLGSHNFFP